MFRFPCIYNFKLIHSICKTCGLQPRTHIALAANNNGLPKPLALVHYGRAQYTLIVAFRKNHPRLRRSGASVNSTQDTGCWVHSSFKRQLISIHVHNRTARYTSVHSSTRNCWRNAVDQAWVKGCRDDVISAKAQFSTIG